MKKEQVSEKVAAKEEKKKKKDVELGPAWSWSIPLKGN